MTITPSFKLSQNTAHILLTIHIPYTKISKMKADIDRNEIYFNCKPYILHLSLPHSMIDTDVKPAKAKYDAETMDVVIEIPKEEEGMVFPDLDLISKFLRPKKMKEDSESAEEKKLMEVLGDEGNKNDSGQNEGGATVNKEKLLNLFNPKYGFANGYSNVFKKKRECLNFEMLLSRNLTPEEIPDAEKRRFIRKEVEEKTFDLDRFLQDNEALEDDALFEMAMNKVPYWEQWSMEQSGEDGVDRVTQRLEDSLSMNDEITFTRVERDTMARIRTRTPSLENSPARPLLMGLYDILTAYAYDYRITDGEPTTESGFNIGILSSTLSWFEDYTSVGAEVMMTQSMRRLVIYPYLRNFDLGVRCLWDALCIMTCGKRMILKCLLAIQSIFEDSEKCDAWNTLYLNNYCIWIQFLGDVPIEIFTMEVASILDRWVHDPDFVKHSLGLGLEKLLEDSDSDYSDDDDSSYGGSSCADSAYASDSDDEDASRLKTIAE